ncbi:hypothetical protein BVIET440_10261 [Burkholderia vietnamiensis]
MRHILKSDCFDKLVIVEVISRICKNHNDLSQLVYAYINLLIF